MFLLIVSLYYSFNDNLLGSLFCWEAAVVGSDLQARAYICDCCIQPTASSCLLKIILEIIDGLSRVIFDCFELAGGKSGRFFKLLRQVLNAGVS